MQKQRRKRRAAARANEGEAMGMPGQRRVTGRPVHSSGHIHRAELGTPAALDCCLVRLPKVCITLWKTSLNTQLRVNQNVHLSQHSH